MTVDLISPSWPAAKNVRAYSTTRLGGVSCAPYNGLNLGLHVGDERSTVVKNRQLLADKMQLNRQPVWLQQTHSNRVVELEGVNSEQDQVADILQADGCYTNKPKAVCTVMTADCLPLLLSNTQGSWVAAVHAGWRGLLAGIIQRSIESYPGKSSDVIAWMGPAISANNFEVGPEVRDQFMAVNQANSRAFSASLKRAKYLCDIYELARVVMAPYGVTSYGGDYCTFEDLSLFYSYRRDGQTGRMASLIWMDNSLC